MIEGDGQLQVQKEIEGEEVGRSASECSEAVLFR